MTVTWGQPPSAEQRAKLARVARVARAPSPAKTGKGTAAVPPRLQTDPGAAGTDAVIWSVLPLSRRFDHGPGVLLHIFWCAKMRMLEAARGASCTIMVYTGATMAMAKRAQVKSARAKHVRRSVTLPPKIARQVETLARQRALSDNRVLVELIEQGIEAQRQKEKAFFQLAERFRAASDPEQVKQLGDQLGRFVFGE